MELTAEQSQAVKKVKQWWTTKQQVFELSGAAGTGKTTLAKFIVQELGLHGTQKAFCAFTGKAALVLKQKSCTPASTVHSLIYKAKEDEHTGEPCFSFDRNSLKNQGIKLVILDEAPMLSKEVAEDLLACGVKILALGDKWQLPPVKSEAYFGVNEPDFTLNEIHRQAEDNPIIALATAARSGVRIPVGTYGNSQVLSMSQFSADSMLDANVVICGKNNTRHSMNDLYRQQLGTKAKGIHPQVGERLICLRNNKAKGLLNGQMFSVVSQHYDGRYARCQVLPLDDPYAIEPIKTVTPIEFFQGKDADLDWKLKKKFDEFGYGWVTTCHKFQGSQAEHVIIIDESGVFRNDSSKWLYTAITRASEKVTIYVA